MHLLKFPGFSAQLLSPLQKPIHFKFQCFERIFSVRSACKPAITDNCKTCASQASSSLSSALRAGAAVFAGRLRFAGAAGLVTPAALASAAYRSASSCRLTETLGGLKRFSCSGMLCESREHGVRWYTARVAADVCAQIYRNNCNDSISSSTDEPRKRYYCARHVNSPAPWPRTRRGPPPPVP